LFSGSGCRAATTPPRAAAERLARAARFAGSLCAAARGATRRSATSSTPLNRYVSEGPAAASADAQSRRMIPKRVASPCRCGCLKLHLRDRFELGDFFLDGGEPGNLVLGESGEADIMAGCLKLLQHADEAVLVDLGQLGEMVVREHIRKLGLFARVILEVHRDLFPAKQCGRFEAPVPARNKAAAVRDGDGGTPRVAFDHGGNGGDLGGRVRVGIFRVRLQV